MNVFFEELWNQKQNFITNNNNDSKFNEEKE